MSWSDLYQSETPVAELEPSALREQTQPASVVQPVGLREHREQTLTAFGVELHEAELQVAAPQVAEPQVAELHEPALEARTKPAEAVLDAAGWVSRQLHREALERFVPPGSRVLQLCSGIGSASHSFTEVLHHLGCKVSVSSASLDELASSRDQAEARGFGASIEGYFQRDISALDGIADGAYDAVVAYGGALSYALERRDRALVECIRVLRPKGVLVISVRSLWGTLHQGLPSILGRDLVQNRAIIRSGTASESMLGEAGLRSEWQQPERRQAEQQQSERQQSERHPADRQLCHLFRAAELEAFLRRGGLELLSLSASSALSTGAALAAPVDPGLRSALLEYERSACVERGYLDSGTHLIAVARR